MSRCLPQSFFFLSRIVVNSYNVRSQGEEGKEGGTNELTSCGKTLPCHNIIHSFQQRSENKSTLKIILNSCMHVDTCIWVDTLLVFAETNWVCWLIEPWFSESITCTGVFMETGVGWGFKAGDAFLYGHPCVRLWAQKVWRQVLTLRRNK